MVNNTARMMFGVVVAPSDLPEPLVFALIHRVTCLWVLRVPSVLLRGHVSDFVVHLIPVLEWIKNPL